MTDSSERPEDPAVLVPSPSFEVPVITASLSRRELRQRLEASSVEPAVETRRERRERELALASATASAASEQSSSVPSFAAPAASVAVQPAAAAEPAAAVPAATVAGAPSAAPSVTASRRARRDASGLEHLLRAPAAAATPPAVPIVAAAIPAAAAASAVAVATAAPVAAAVPAASAVASAASTADEQPVARDIPVPAPTTTVRTMTFSREDEAEARPRGPVAAPRVARSSVSSGDPRRRVLPRMRRAAPSQNSRKRTIVNSVVMVATAGLVATIALPAYAYSDINSIENPKISAASGLGVQQLTVAGVNGQDSSRDGFTTTGNVAAMDSTNGTTVSATVQALASELMADVASGKLVGSVPDHIVEIRNLANGVAVPGCGVDYRVLQTIKVAVDNFDKVGVSDINRHCTGQIEGAGTASSHYKDGGGHAVDFYILNGHGLTGADSDSIKLINLLDPLVPKGSGLGQAECRSTSLPLSNFAPFDDTCTHLHVDFGAAQGVALTS